MDLDLALRADKPDPLTDERTSEQKREMENLERSNHMSLMIMKRAIPEAFRGTMSDKITTAKDFLEDLEKRFAKNEKAEASTLLANLVSMRYTEKRNIREYIMEMSHIASKLRALKLEVSEGLLVHLVLISLSTQYSQFRVSYNCQKTWSLNELISHCVQEEERMKHEKTGGAHLAITSKDKRNERKKTEEVVVPDTQKEQNEENPTGCFFCKSEGPIKKHCTNYHAWRAKKGMPKLPKTN